ncbi:MAG: pyridoxal-phosphate dependent enzyme, partial [Nitrospinota bacterium]
MLTLCDIWSARQRIADVLRPTPLLPSPVLRRWSGSEVRLKPECLQTTGSFKIRGAVNKIRSLGGKARRVVACSSGNHGQATAFAAQQAGMAATIVVPRRTAPNKIEAIRAW